MFSAYFRINEIYIFVCGVCWRKKYNCGEQLLPDTCSCQAKQWYCYHRVYTGTTQIL